MNQYLLSIYQPDGSEQPAPHVLQAIMKDVNALRQEMKAAGAWVFSGGLHPPSTATVVRVKDGQLLTTDGPFAEGKEHWWILHYQGRRSRRRARMGRQACPGDDAPN